MRNRLLVFCALLALIVGTAAAQDARSVLQAAATTMGVTNLKSTNIPGPAGKVRWARITARSWIGRELK